ncbi:MAG: DUF1007 family protein [Desulfobacterales bacterium]|nr:DUF1007 family protein [Desulfobacterales bacterium]
MPGRFYFYRFLTLLFFVLLALAPEQTFAHPHVFIEQRTTLVFDDKGFAGFRINWAFDEMFSVMIGEDFDKDQNKHLDENEVRVIKEKAFGYIAEYNYYINVKIDGKPFAVKFIKDFNATLEKGKLKYEFFIPCHVTAVNADKQIILSPYDPEYYSAIYFPDIRHISLENTGPFIVETRSERDMSTLIYYETVNPLAIFLTFRQKQ